MSCWIRMYWPIIIRCWDCAARHLAGQLRWEGRRPAKVDRPLEAETNRVCFGAVVSFQWLDAALHFWARHSGWSRSISDGLRVWMSHLTPRTSAYISSGWVFSRRSGVLGDLYSLHRRENGVAGPAVNQRIAGCLAGRASTIPLDNYSIHYIIVWSSLV